MYIKTQPLLKHSMVRASEQGYWSRRFNSYLELWKSFRLFLHVLLSNHRYLKDQCHEDTRAYDEICAAIHLFAHKLQSSTKVLRQLTKTNAFELTIVFCIWMKTLFSSVVTPHPSKQCCKPLRGCSFFVSSIENRGRGGYLSRGERGEFTSRKKE